MSALGGAALMAGGVLIGRSSPSGEASAPPATVVVAASTPSVTATSPSTASAPATTVPATTVPATIGDPTAGTAPATVPPLPGELRADFTWTPEAPTAGSSIRFVDQSSGSPAFWEFRWRRNSITTSRPPNVATNLSEDTEVTLTVCSDRERTHCNTITKLIDVA